MSVQDDTAQRAIPMTPPEGAAAPASSRARLMQRLSLEVALEVVLIVLSAALFTYMLVESFRVHPDVGRLPRIAAGVGWLTLLLYTGRRIWTWGQLATAGQIMDTGFDEEGLSRRTIVTRTLRLVLATTGMFLGAWVVGFHIAVPVYVFGYLVLWGGVRWYWALATGAFYLAYMVVAYDIAVRAQWPEPLIPLLPSR